MSWPQIELTPEEEWNLRNLKKHKDSELIEIRNKKGNRPVFVDMIDSVLEERREQRASRGR